MSPDDIDPSLRAGEPLLESLDDGFSPPPRSAETSPATEADLGLPPELALGPKSPF
jgi:hypothetical protein